MNPGCNFAVNDKVLKRNSRKDSRKGDRLPADWLGPYEIKEITPKGVCVLSNKDGIILKTKTNSCHLKPYVQRASSIDGVTDQSISENEGVFVSRTTNTRLVGIKTLKHAHADGVLAADV